MWCEMKIEHIKEQWKEDSKIDQAKLTTDSLSIAVLHNKYYMILSDERLVLKRMDYDYKKLYLDKWEYYTGSICQEKLEQRGWEPNSLKIIKSEAAMYIDADDEIILQKAKIDFQKEKVEYLTAIVERINTRGFQIKNAIDNEKFLNAQV